MVEAFRDEAPTVHCLVNYGTKVNLELLYHASRYTNTLVWLDNDSKHVIEQAKLMARTIKMLNPNVIVKAELVCQDPKHYSPATVIDTISEANDWN